MVESKVLPGSVLNRRVKEKAARIEQETGRKPGKKESKELKEEAKLDLLPMAPPSRAACGCGSTPIAPAGAGHIPPRARRRGGEPAGRSLPGLAVSLISTQTSPQASWRTGWPQEPPVGFQH